MSSTGKKLSARERRAAEAKANTSAQVPQRAGPNPPISRAGPTTAPAPRSRRPELERTVPAIAERRPESSPRRGEDARRKDDVAESGRKRVRGDSEKNLGASDSTRPKHSGPPPKSKELFNSSAVAASHLSKILCPGAEFPPPTEMLKKDAYSSMALHCMTFLSSLNSLTIDHEVTARSQSRKLTNLQRTCDDFKRQRREAEDKAAALGAVVKENEDKHREINVTFTESESERKLLKHKVSDLTSRLNDAARLQEAAVQRAVDRVKREMAIEYESRIGRAKEKLRMINDRPRIDIIDLAQVQSNIEFVELLQSDKAPDLSEELVELKKQEEGLSEAEEIFGNHMRELEEILKTPRSGGGAPIAADPICQVIHPASSSSSSSDDEDSSDSETEVETGQVEETVVGA